MKEAMTLFVHVVRTTNTVNIGHANEFYTRKCLELYYCWKQSSDKRKTNNNGQFLVFIIIFTIKVCFLKSLNSFGILPFDLFLLIKI